MLISDHSSQCPFCRETIPEIHVTTRRPQGSERIRQGLLCILLAAVVNYFAGGYSEMRLSVSIPPIVTTYLSPILLVSGLGLSLSGLHRRGLHRRVRS